MKLNEIFKAAGLNVQEIEDMDGFLNHSQPSWDFYDHPAYQKLYEYFAFESCEMPYGIAKARTGDPDSWILEYLEEHV